MPALSYSVADFVAFTKIRSADVNSKFTSIQTLLNTTGLDDTNIQNAGITRSTKLKTGTAGALIVNAASTGAMSEVSPGVQGTIVVGGGSGTPPKFLAAGTAGQFLKSNGSGADHTYAGVPDNAENLGNLRLSASVGSNALTIALKGNDGNDPSSTNPVTVGFRSATLTSGAYVFRSATAATSLVISSGSTLGQTSAKAEFIYVYAIDNAGTVELAASTHGGFDEGQLVTTTAEGGAGAADSRYAIYSTTARSSVACRLLGRIKSTQATAGTWVTSPAEITSPRMLPPPPRGVYEFVTGNGYGSSNTNIRRFSTTSIDNGGNDISILYNDGTNGTVLQIEQEGIYAVSWRDYSTTGTYSVGIIDFAGAGVSGAAGPFDATNRLSLYAASSGTIAANQLSFCSNVLRLRPGQQVACIAVGGPNSTTANEAKFRVERIA